MEVGKAGNSDGPAILRGRGKKLTRGKRKGRKKSSGWTEITRVRIVRKGEGGELNLSRAKKGQGNAIEREKGRGQSLEFWLRKGREERSSLAKA